MIQNNCNTRRTPHACTQRKKLKTNSDQSNQNYFNFQTNLNKTASAQNIEKLYKNANLAKF